MTTEGIVILSIMLFSAGFLIGGYVVLKWEDSQAYRYLILWKNGWKYIVGDCAMAPDEDKPRPIREAVERQKELDKMEKLNLPDTRAKNLNAYKVGGWAE